MKVITLGLNNHETELQHRLKGLALACALATGVALAVTPVLAQSAPPAAPQSPPPQAAQPTLSSPSGPASAPSATTPSGPAAQPGIRAVDPATLRLTFYTVRPVDMLASKLIGLDVHNLKNEDIGEIQDLVVDEGKTIRGVVLAIGGFLGIGERYTAVEPGAIVVTREPGGSLKAVVNTTREDLQKAPEFKFEGNVARSK